MKAFLLFLISMNAFSLSQSFRPIEVSKKTQWYSGDSSKIILSENDEFKSAPVSYEDLSPLLERIENSSFAYMIPQALERLGYQNKEEFVNFIYACKFDNDRTRGLYSHDQSYKYIAKFDIAVSMESYFLSTFNDNEKPRYYFVRDLPPLENMFSSISFVEPNHLICILPSMDRFQAASTLVHEFTHFLENKIEGLEPLSGLGKHEAILRILQKSGGEKDAFSNQVRFLMEETSDEDKKKKLLEDWGNSIDLNGSIIDSERFDREIIKDRNYLPQFEERRIMLLEKEQAYIEYMVKKVSKASSDYQELLDYKDYLLEYERNVLDIIESNNNLAKNQSETLGKRQEKNHSNLAAAREKLQEITVRLKTYLPLMESDHTYQETLLMLNKQLQKLKNQLQAN